MILFGFLTIHDLPVVNATLNGIAAILLLVGFTLIRQRKVDAHQKVMWSAFTVSCLFLVCYLVYHYNVGSVRFDKPGWVRTLYLWILGTHTLLAGAVPVLAVITLTRAQKRNFVKHRAIAKWTFPIWLYVSVTGVVVYLMLYQIRPRL
jgi:putative membrane protein